MPGRIGLTLSESRFVLAPGLAPAFATLQVSNLGSTVDQFALRAEGTAAAWARFTPAEVSLFPDDASQVMLEVRAPADALAGTYSLRVIAVSRENPAEQTVLDVVLEVAADELAASISLDLVPRRVRLRGGGTATLALHMATQANSDRRVRVLAEDPSNAVQVAFEHQEVLLPARGETRATLLVRPRQAPLFGASRSLPFTLSAQLVDDPFSAPLASTAGELVHVPLLYWLTPATWLPALRRRALWALPILAALAVLIWVCAAPGARTPGPPAKPTLLTVAAPPTPVVASSPTAVAVAVAASPIAAANANAGAGGAGNGAGSGSNGSPPEIVQFAVRAPTDDSPAFMALDVDVRGASETTIQRSSAEQGRGARPFQQVEQAEYTLVASNAAGTTTRTLSLYVLRPPSIDEFDVEAVPDSDQVRVTWRTTGADQVLVAGVSLEGPTGGVQVARLPSGEYVLRAVNAAGETTRTAQVGGAAGSPTPTPTLTPTATPTPVPAQPAPAAATATLTPTATPTPTLFPTPTNTPTLFPTPTDVPTLFPTPTEAATLFPTPTEAPTLFPTPTEAPTLFPTPTETPTPSPTPTQTPTLFPTPTSTPIPTPATPTPTPTLPPPPPVVDSGRVVMGIDEGVRNPNVMADVGAEWDRVIIPWTAVQPSGPTDFSGLGRTLPMGAFQAELNRGVRVAGLVQFTPAWAQANPAFGERSPPRNLNLPWDHPDNYFGRFVFETARYYAGTIDEWIIWNEPEFRPGEAGTGGSFTWLGTDEEYAQLLKVGYMAVKAANPNAIVSFAGTSYWTDQLANPPRAQFYERLLAILRRDPDAARYNFYHDVVALNLYRSPDDVYRVHAVFRGIMTRNGIDKTIWLTESNAMPTDDTRIRCNHANDPIQTTMQEQANYAIQAYALAAAAGYGRAGFYQMVDDDPCQQPAVWGVSRDDGSTRPVAAALKTVIQNLSGFIQARFVPLNRLTRAWDTWPENPASYTPNWQIYQVAADLPGNRRVSALWNGDGAPACVRVARNGVSAVLVDKQGGVVAASDIGGFWRVDLAGATAHYPDDPAGYYFIGGDPLLLVENGVNPSAAVVPPVLGCGPSAPVPTGPVPPVPTGPVTAPPAAPPTQPDTPSTANAAFVIAVDPEGQTVGLGDAAEFFITSRTTGTFNGPLTFRVGAWSTQRFPQPRDPSTLPLQITLPQSVQVGQTATVHIETSGGDPGIYYLSIEVLGGGTTQVADLALVLEP